tara:strand:- start:16 stop:243 length:228 start_codon:yes stop_codon:yes gene_type:complete
MNKLNYFIVIFFFSSFVFCQNDLLDEISKETSYKNTFELPAFKAMKIVNNQSKVSRKRRFISLCSTQIWIDKRRT